MSDLLKHIKAVNAKNNDDHWVSFSEIREAFPAEAHVEWIAIQIYILYQTHKIDVLVEKGGTELFLRAL